MKRSFILFISLVLLFVPLLHAESPYFYVIENDTTAFKNTADLESALNDFIARLGNQGFPHCEILLDAYNKTEQGEYFHYRVDKGSKVAVDTVVFGDYSPREISLLSRYITLPETGFFHFEDVRGMIEELKTNKLLKVEDRADIYGNGLRLYTEAKQDIRFDALASYKQENDRAGVVGDLSLELVNLGGLGRLASFYWSRPTLGVNAFDLAYTEPYIFNQPFSVSLSFSQRFQDSLYVKRDLDLGVLYHFNQRSGLTVNYINEQISTLSAGSDSGFVTQNRSGSTVSLNYLSKAGALSGSFHIKSGLHFSPGQRVSRSELNALLAFRKSSVGVNLYLLGGYVSSDEPVPLYDRFKLGGATFLRGAYFDQYITNAYIGWKLETGYFRRTRLFAFYDGAVMQGQSSLLHHFGIGLSLPAGNNRLSIALGMSSDESIRQAKFHVSWEMGDR